MNDRDPRVAKHYDELAGYWEQVAESPSKAELLWPAIDAMLPDLAGRRVLDAGCGSGDWSAELVDRGANVLGVDVSEQMVRVAEQRVPDAEFVRTDLEDGIDHVADDSFDVVLCQHVFSHVGDLTTPLSEFARVLADGGDLVVSTHNPVHDYLVVRDESYPSVDDESDTEARVETGPGSPSYAETERYDITWNPGDDANRATYYRRPIEGLLSPLIAAGFEIREVREPTPDGSFARAYPEIAETLRRLPATSICLRATH
ncbi:class I SAM-dependent methyltransferase [Halobaculum lipolyticum]|uniref:Class I SAM-dependent methyltransferase n=1 Tax=Halobaculum lipolyticum TaxID=3032001 RepID=A0ABD5WG58_9EURY|nr:class I SAM-dependent methyltransferase [Halobaculum sp. DT31]